MSSTNHANFQIDDFTHGKNTIHKACNNLNSHFDAMKKLISQRHPMKKYNSCFHKIKPMPPSQQYFFTD